MSVSRQASFAAGIAAAKKRHRQRHHNRQQELQLQGGDFLLPPVLYKTTSLKGRIRISAEGSNNKEPLPIVQTRPATSSSTSMSSVKDRDQCDVITVVGSYGQHATDAYNHNEDRPDKALQDHQRLSYLQLQELDYVGARTGHCGGECSKMVHNGLKNAIIPAQKPRMACEVKPFTKESLEKINLRTSNLIRDYGFLPRRSPNLLDGAQLPAKFEPFPPELLGKPIEELDQYVYEKVSQTTIFMLV